MKIDYAALTASQKAGLSTRYSQAVASERHLRELMNHAITQHRAAQKLLAETSELLLQEYNELKATNTAKGDKP